MSEPYKEERRIIYTEIVYFDGEGNEIGREQMGNDEWYDTVSSEPLTPDELADYGLDEEVAK